MSGAPDTAEGRHGEKISYGSFRELGALFVGVLALGALLLWVHIRAPHLGNSHVGI